MTSILEQKLDAHERGLLRDIRAAATEETDPVVGLAIHLAEIVEDQALHSAAPQTRAAATGPSSSSSRAYSTAVAATPTKPSSVTLPPSVLSRQEPWQAFFDGAIDLYVLPDIQRLTDEIRPDNVGPSSGLRGCTIPLAMMLFAAIDLFGFLTRPEPNADKLQTSRNMRYFLGERDYFEQTYEDNSKLLVEIYRHGLMHQIFPKASAIAKAGADQPLIDRQRGNHILNVDRLSTDVVAAMQRIRQDLEENRHPELTARMNGRLRQLQEEDTRAASRMRRRGHVRSPHN